MRTILIALLMTLATQAGAENLTYDDLIKRNELYFKKFSNVPFSGEVFGKFSGSFKDGKKTVVGNNIMTTVNSRLRVFIQTTRKTGFGKITIQTEFSS